MKGNTNVIIAAAVVIVLVVGGYFLFFNKKPSRVLQAPKETVQEVIPTIIPDDLGLEVAIRSDKRAMKFTVTKADDIEKIEYQISYTKTVDGEDVPEGLIGEVEAKPGQPLSIEYREFGTCSSGTCRYDKVVSDIKLTLKITKKDGKIYQSEKTVSL